jgi:hypothetical protein
MVPQILLPLLALHHDLYPVLRHLALPHLAGMVSVRSTVIHYLASGYLFNKSLCTLLIRTVPLGIISIFIHQLMHR